MIVETIAYALDLFESGRLIAQYLDLSVVPGHPRYGPRLLTQPWLGVDVERPEDPRLRAPEPDLAAEYFRTGGNRGSVTPPLVVIRELRNAAARNALRPLTGVRRASGAVIDVNTAQRFTVLPVLLEGGADGLAALRVDDFVGAQVPPTASAEVLAAGRRGLAALEVVDEISILAVPDIHIQPRPVNPVDLPPPCAPEGGLPSDAQPPVPSIVPIGDTPPRFALDQIYAVQSAMVAQCERRRDRVALLDAPLETCSRLTFAASELRAAALDLRSGVHLAPANVPLAWAQDVSLGFDDALHGWLNSIGVNAIRPQPGRGLRVLGARTVSSDSDWRFVNVRRLISMIEKSIDVSIQWAVFEPNDWRTRAKLTLAIQSLLIGLWQRGAMVGAVAAEAFFVRCDDTNNPAEPRARGQLQIDVGVAPSVPFEFVVLRIGRDANGFTISAAELSPAAS